jgi:hypothetical protein
VDIEGILEKARSSLGPDIVFAPAQERDGVIVIPASKVTGAGGGGGDESEGGGGGGGYLTRARPAGALIIERDGSIRWKVPFDINRLVAGAQMVGVAFFFFLWLTERSKSRSAADASVAIAALDGATGPKARIGSPKTH